MTEPAEPFWQSMRRVKQPALVIVGEHDRVVPARLGLRLADQLPHAELLTLPEVGHVPQFEATGEILDPLLSFLARSHKRAAHR